MAIEKEIKLTASASGVDSAFDWLRSKSLSREGETQYLSNTYYDTPDGDLNGRKAALRIRRVGDTRIQTLKTKGDFVAGAHHRQEWEWELSGNSLDLSLLVDTPVCEISDLSQLNAVFETNFERRLVMIQQGNDLIEVAFDKGEVVSGHRARPLNEIEFELKGGDASSLLTWAKQLADEVPVFLNVISKAEQGYYLAGVPLPEPDAASIQSMYDFFHCLSLCWLRGTRFPAECADFSMVRRAAESTGIEADFEKLVDQLSSDQPVNALIPDGLLGRVQLALAGFSAA